MEHLGLHKHFCKSNVRLYWVDIQLNRSILSISNSLESVDHAASSAKTHEKSGKPENKTSYNSKMMGQWFLKLQN